MDSFEKKFNKIPQNVSAQQYLNNPLSQQETWDVMINDIEQYQQIKKIILDMFLLLKDHMPNQIQLFIIDYVNKLQDAFPVDTKEFDDFMNLVKIFSDQLAQNLDNEDISDFATPYKLATKLDTMFITLDKERVEYSISRFGQKMLACFYHLQDDIQKANWQEGWK